MDDLVVNNFVIIDRLVLENGLVVLCFITVKR